MTPSQSAVQRHCSTVAWNEFYALTLGLRWRSCDTQRIRFLPSAGPPPEYVQNFHHFMNVLNNHAFGKAARRGFKRISVIPVLEQDRSSRFHYHAAIDRPAHVSHSEFCGIISETWRQSRWGKQRLQIIPGADGGWTKYILKRASKVNWFDSIDWQNFHNPCASHQPVTPVTSAHIGSYPLIAGA